VVWSGEFGRTPTSQGGKGRDHNPNGYTMWMAGGGIKGGKIIGETDEIGLRAVQDKVHIHDSHATILSLLGLDHRKLTIFSKAASSASPMFMAKTISRRGCWLSHHSAIPTFVPPCLCGLVFKTRSPQRHRDTKNSGVRGRETGGWRLEAGFKGSVLDSTRQRPRGCV
jgi:hypothetical protein